MARRIDQMPGAPRVSYPWDEWLDGSAWELAQGEDFKISVKSMGAMVTQAAIRRGIRVTVRIRGTRMYVQASLDGERIQ